MKKILFATEFYDHAPRVFRYAAELAHVFKADLLLMHAYGKPEARISNEKMLQERNDQVIDKLIDFVTTHLPETHWEKTQIDYLAVNDYPVNAILDTFLEQEADLIVMGMTGKTNRVGSILGNTTLSVLAQADCQVLIVPEEATFEGIDHLLYTLDFEFRDLEAIHYLKEWSKVLAAPLHALHVVEGDENDLTVLKKMMILKETFKKDKTINFDLRYGHFREEIEKFALDKKTDIVAMISHKRNFISRLLASSGVERIARHTRLPLLVIKEDAYEFDEPAWQWVKLVNSIA